MNYFVFQTLLLLGLAYLLGALAGCIMRKFIRGGEFVQMAANEVGHDELAVRGVKTSSPGKTMAGTAAGGLVGAGAASAHVRDRFRDERSDVEISIDETPAAPRPAGGLAGDRAVDMKGNVVAEGEAKVHRPVPAPLPQRGSVPSNPLQPSDTTVTITGQERQSGGTQTGMTEGRGQGERLSDRIQKAAPSLTPPLSTPTSETSITKTTGTSSGRSGGSGSTVSVRKASGDDLTLIKGVGKILAAKLNDYGITKYSQIAQWTELDIRNIDEKLNFQGRIEREDWIGQAKALAAGIPYRKSVKSKLPDDHKDDLTQIRGIGVIEQNKLYEMGYTRFENIMAWTINDIKRAEEVLGFHGRIARENWMAQAGRLKEERDRRMS